MNNKQVAHLWANKSRERAKGSSFYFEGDTIYSYGPHFPIARHFKGAILFTTEGYSVSTSKHKSYVLSACTHLPVYHVMDPKQDPSRKDVENYGQRIKAQALAVARARNPQWTLKTLESLVSEGNEFCERFGFKTRFTVPDNFEELKARARVQAEKNKKAKLAKMEKLAKENEKTLLKWLAGESDSLPRHLERVYLRVKTNQNICPGFDPKDERTRTIVMETSKGATVPLEEAKKAFRFVMLKRATGWHRNGEQFPIGEFHLDAVNEQGIVAGCHRIGWDEIERFAKTQGWI